MNWRKLLGIGLASCLLAVAGCGLRSTPPVLEIEGPAMGASYRIQVVQPPASLDTNSLRKEIDRILAGINLTFSTYAPSSELSRLNRNPSLEWLPISDPLYQVMRIAQIIGHRSNGAFDVTVGPLVDLWGFGPQFRPDHIPSEPEIQRTLARVGLERIHLRDTPVPAVRRDLPGLEIDLNALVPGYAADLVAGRLEQLGVERYLVDMGGEYRLRGRNARDGLWQLAIEEPGQTHGHPHRRLVLTDTAVSTSGSYKNYFEIKGQRYSHEIDPRTGYPVSHDLASVTVVADNAMSADAWSTALLVLGAVEGLRVAENEKIAALFLVRGAEDNHQEITSSLMTRYLSN